VSGEHYVAHVGYTSFGHAVVTSEHGLGVSNAIFSSYGFTGREYDGVVKLQFSRDRFYDPALGRWLSQDPIGFAGGDTNPYCYVGNSPLNYTDPNGHLGLIGAAVGGLVGGVIGGVGAYIESGGNWDAVWAGAGKGALIGAVAGFTGGLAAGAAFSLVGGATATGGALVGATLLSGAVGGAVGDAASQALGIGLGWQQQYNGWQTVGAAAGGFLGAGINLGLGRALGMPLSAANACNVTTSEAVAQNLFHGTSGALGGAAGDAVLQGLEFATGQRTAWDWDRTAVSAAVGAATGIGSYWFSRSCHTGRMLIRVAEGKKRADAIRAGDMLWSRSEFNPEGPLELKVVLEVFERVAHVWHLQAGSQLLETTAEHPYYALGKEWTATALLEVGDWLWTDENRWVRFEAVSDSGRVETVYNFRVADYHTYFVGSSEWGFSVWAHNTYLTEAEIAEYAGNYSKIAQANGGKFYRAWEQVAPGRTLGAADRRAIRSYLRDNADQFPGVSIKTRNQGGLAGDAVTQGFDEAVAKQLQARGWRMENGPLSSLPQEWIPGPVPGSRAGGTQVDLTASRMFGDTRRTLRVQTIDTLADGVTPTPREAANAAQIRAAFPNDHLLLIPKPEL